MTTLFLICAAVGGTVMLFQLAMLLFGVGGEHADFDSGGLDGGHDFGHDFGHDVGHDAGADADGDHDFSGDQSHQSNFASTWLFSVISFRSVVAGLTFFGLGGLAAREHFFGQATFAIALLSGGAAMYLVGMLYNSIKRLTQDGTMRIQNAKGKRGTVYIPIPPKKSGVGKVQVKMQDRLVELQAVTSEPEKLSTGARVEVVNVISSNTVEVQLVRETAKSKKP